MVYFRRTLTQCRSPIFVNGPSEERTVISSCHQRSSCDILTDPWTTFSYSRLREPTEGGSITSTSSSSITSMTSARLSKKEFTATRSMRFVAALYSTRKIDSKFGELANTEKSRCTRGDSSLSTRSERRATEASRASGKGISSVLLFGGKGCGLASV